jgi:hypothetical protein
MMVAESIGCSLALRRLMSQVRIWSAAPLRNALLAQSAADFPMRAVGRDSHTAGLRLDRGAGVRNPCAGRCHEALRQHFSEDEALQER